MQDLQPAETGADRRRDVVRQLRDELQRRVLARDFKSHHLLHLPGPEAGRRRPAGLPGARRANLELGRHLRRSLAGAPQHRFAVKPARPHPAQQLEPPPGGADHRGGGGRRRQHHRVSAVDREAIRIDVPAEEVQQIDAVGRSRQVIERVLHVLQRQRVGAALPVADHAGDRLQHVLRGQRLRHRRVEIVPGRRDVVTLERGIRAEHPGQLRRLLRAVDRAEEHPQGQAAMLDRRERTFEPLESLAVEHRAQAAGPRGRQGCLDEPERVRPLRRDHQPREVGVFGTGRAGIAKKRARRDRVPELGALAAPGGLPRGHHEQRRWREHDRREFPAARRQPESQPDPHGQHQGARRPEVVDLVVGRQQRQAAPRRDRRRPRGPDAIAGRPPPGRQPGAGRQGHAERTGAGQPQRTVEDADRVPQPRPRKGAQQIVGSRAQRQRHDIVPPDRNRNPRPRQLEADRRHDPDRQNPSDGGRRAPGQRPSLPPRPQRPSAQHRKRQELIAELVDPTKEQGGRHHGVPRAIRPAQHRGDRPAPGRQRETPHPHRVVPDDRVLREAGGRHRQGHERGGREGPAPRQQPCEAEAGGGRRQRAAPGHPQVGAAECPLRRAVEQERARLHRRREVPVRPLPRLDPRVGRDHQAVVGEVAEITMIPAPRNDRQGRHDERREHGGSGSARPHVRLRIGVGHRGIRRTGGDGRGHRRRSGSGRCSRSCAGNTTPHMRRRQRTPPLPAVNPAASGPPGASASAGAGRGPSRRSVAPGGARAWPPVSR